MPPSESADQLPAEIVSAAFRQSYFPVDKLGSLLTMAMVNPLDQETIRSLEGKTGLDIK